MTDFQKVIILASLDSVLLLAVIAIYIASKVTKDSSEDGGFLLWMLLIGMFFVTVTIFDIMQV